jgi:hypothetical protein
LAKKEPGIVKDFEWNLGEKDKRGLERKIEKGIVIAIVPASNKEAEVMEHLDELEFLAETAGVESVKRFTQRLEQPNTLTYFGKGKLEEVGQYIRSHEEISVAIFDDDLSPKQLHAIEEVFKVKVLDRSGLTRKNGTSARASGFSANAIYVATLARIMDALRASAWWCRNAWTRRKRN